MTAAEKEVLQPWEHLISLDRIGQLYEEGIRAYGGLRGSPKHGCVESSLGAAAMAEYYDPNGQEELSFIFACHLLVLLAQNHCFPDGNKRVAWASFIEVLHAWRLTVNASTDEIVALVEDVAGKKKGMAAADVAARLSSWLTALA